MKNSRVALAGLMLALVALGVLPIIELSAPASQQGAPAGAGDLVSQDGLSGSEAAGTRSGASRSKSFRVTVVPDGSDPLQDRRLDADGQLRQAESRLARALAAGGGQPRQYGGTARRGRHPATDNEAMLASWNHGPDEEGAGVTPVQHVVSLAEGAEPDADLPATCLRGCGMRTYRECCSPCRPGAWTLPQLSAFEQRCIRIGGWIDQGISVVANNPADRYNGPVTFNDRDGEYQMNQFWLFMERAVDTGGCGWDFGGRIDFVYGTDGRFTQSADGLEADWNQTSRFYQAALPQFYLDVAYNDWTLRIGHFLTILGYEVELAPENFFYSHAYVRQYGEPVTHTGALLTRRFGDRLSVSAGVHRGNDQFNDTDGRDSLDFLGGATWTSWNERLSLAFGLSATEDGPGVTTQVYSLVASLQVTDNLTYVIQHDSGQTTGSPNRNRTVEWYGVNQYLLYDINTCWAAGLRFEWFRDDDGARVTGLGDGNQNTGPFVGNFYELSAGLNWKPHANLTVRPEVRWDWFDGGAPLGFRPYDAGDRNNQFLLGCDLICTF